jgi:hypothetical protein
MILFQFWELGNVILKTNWSMTNYTTLHFFKVMRWLLKHDYVEDRLLKIKIFKYELEVINVWTM